MLHIKCAAGVKVGLAPRINRDGAIGRLGNRCADWGINLLIAAFGGLIIKAVVVIIRYSANLQCEKAEGQRWEPATKSKVIPKVTPMNIHVHVAVHEYVVPSRTLSMDFDRMLRLTTHIGLALNYVSIEVANAAVAGSVHHRGPGR